MRRRALDTRGWWVTGALTLLAAALRLPALGRPHEFSFDETYYAKDAFSYLRFGYERAYVDSANGLLLKGQTNVLTSSPEFVVHPPIGKWAIALGEAVFGMNPFGWRIVMALLGVWAVAIVHRTMLRLSRSVVMAAMAGLFMAIDGLAIVMSRTALLDQTLMFLVLSTFWALLRDRDHYAHTLLLGQYGERVPPARRLRPWRWLAIVCITGAVATKWSGLWFAIAFALMALWWDVRERKAHEVIGGRDWLLDLGWVVLAALFGAGGYLLSWIGWFRSTNAWDRNWNDGGVGWLPQSLRALIYYHQQALQFHTNLTSSHPYKAAPYWWPLMIRPTSFSYDTYARGQHGCTVTSCSAEVLALGNVVLWWVASLALVLFVLNGLARLLRLTVSIADHHFAPAESSRLQWDIVGPALVGIGAGWLPWIYWHNRTTFSFYSIVYAPFMFMLAAYALAAFSSRRVVVEGLAPDPAPQAVQAEQLRSAAASALVEPSGEVVASSFMGVVPEPLPAWDARPPVARFEYDVVDRRHAIIAAIVVLAAIGFTVFFYPVWTGQVVPYAAWDARMWLNSWV